MLNTSRHTTNTLNLTIMPFDKFCKAVDEIKRISDELIKVHEESIINTNGTISQIVSKKEEAIKLRDQLYNFASSINTGDSILDHIVKTCVTTVGGKDVKVNNSGWYRYLNAADVCHDSLLITLHDRCIACLQNIKNGVSIDTIKEKFGNQGFTTDYNDRLIMLMYVKARYYNDGSQNYSKVQTEVDTLRKQCEEARELSTSVVYKEAVLNDRIDYLRKDWMLVYHEITELKQTVSTLEDRLHTECLENANLRKQLQVYNEEHADAFNNLRKELLVNNGNLVYISNIRFSPEYDYESIKAHNHKLHIEFKRIYRIFSRNMTNTE